MPLATASQEPVPATVDPNDPKHVRDGHASEKNKVKLDEASIGRAFGPVYLKAGVQSATVGEGLWIGKSSLNIFSGKYDMTPRDSLFFGYGRDSQDYLAENEKTQSRLLKFVDYQHHFDSDAMAGIYLGAQQPDRYIGVSIWDYNNTYVEPTVFVGAGTELLPGTVLRGTTSIADGCTIGPNSYLENVKVGEGTKINASQVYDSEIGSDTTVGPFAYVRPGSRIGSHVRCGDFVEVKNSTIGDGTKISHLTYVGDSDVGKNINFGCGTVTVNYDRVHKSRTVIDDNAFIGCNTNLIAPVHVGEGAYIAAGSTVTDDVPPAALAIARARQQNKRDWANRHKLKEK